MVKVWVASSHVKGISVYAGHLKGDVFYKQDYRDGSAFLIGNEGNGIYSAAFEIYNLLLIISSYGMPMAVSKMVSAKCAKKQ